MLCIFITTVAEIWQEVLGEGLIDSADANFFELGGHSLLVSVLVTKLRANCPSISARDIYTNPTIRTLASVVDTLGVPAAKPCGSDLEASADRCNKLKDYYIPTTSAALMGNIIQVIQS